MKSDIKAKWLAALRSGDYTQCKGTLRHQDGGHCCLGVLAAECDVLRPLPQDWGPGERHADAVCIPVTASGEPLSGVSDVMLGTMLRSGTISTSFMAYTGLHTNDIGELVTMNDDQGKTFAEIADHVEANL